MRQLRSGVKSFVLLLMRQFCSSVLALFEATPEARQLLSGVPSLLRPGVSGVF